jgi:hypothetical protein
VNVQQHTVRTAPLPYVTTARGLECTSGMCQCPNGQMWKNITLGLNAPGYQCVSPAGNIRA